MHYVRTLTSHPATRSVGAGKPEGPWGQGALRGGAARTMNTLTSTPSFLRPAVVRGRVSVVAILLLLMARPSLTFAQSVTAAVAGIVVDARTRQPLSGVLVELGRPAQSMPTDTEGRFRFEAVAAAGSENGRSINRGTPV